MIFLQKGSLNPIVSGGGVCACRGKQCPCHLHGQRILRPAYKDNPQKPHGMWGNWFPWTRGRQGEVLLSSLFAGFAASRSWPFGSNEVAVVWASVGQIQFSYCKTSPFSGKMHICSWLAFAVTVTSDLLF